MYGTTENFLRCFNISSIDELPPLPENDEENKEDNTEDNEHNDEDSDLDEKSDSSDNGEEE